METRDLARAVEEATGRNVDRFFHQWVFSAGHPELKVEYSWDDEQKLARLSVKQAQEVEGQTPLFHLPLSVRFVVDGKAVDVKLTVARAEETFIQPLDGKPTQAIVDPGNHFLKTIDVKKPEEVWKGELAGAERAIDCVRAARALGKAGEPTAVDALTLAMKGDSFWAVRGEAALALAEVRSTAARDAIVGALKSEAHPKARRQQVKALGTFRHDAVAQEAAAAKLHAGDASYFVEAESAHGAGRTRATTAFDSLELAMKRPSYLDVIESNCLARNGRAARRARHRRGAGGGEIRQAHRRAARGHQRAGGAGRAPSGAQAAGAGGAHRAARGRRLPRAHRRGGGAARPRRADAIGALGKAERRDLDGRVRRRAREVVKALSEHATQAEQVRGLRESLEKLESENRELRERMLKIEARLEPKK